MSLSSLHHDPDNTAATCFIIVLIGRISPEFPYPSGILIKATDKSLRRHWAAGRWRDTPCKPFRLMLMSHVIRLRSWRVRRWSLALILAWLQCDAHRDEACCATNAWCILGAWEEDSSLSHRVSSQTVHAPVLKPPLSLEAMSGFQSFWPYLWHQHDCFRHLTICLLAGWGGVWGVEIWVQICSVCLVLLFFWV